MNRLFGILKPEPAPETTPNPEAQAQATQAEQVKLQSQIDRFNAQISQWDNQRTQNKNRAKAAKDAKNLPTAKMLLQQNQLLQQQIETAINSVSMLLQKQAALTKSSMLSDTHNALQGANLHITSNVKQTSVRDIENALMQNEKLDGDLHEIGSYMQTANPMNGRNFRRDLDAELAALSDSDDASEAIGTSYDFPDLKFVGASPNPVPLITTASSSTTKAISSPIPVRTNNNNSTTATRSNVLDLF